MGHMASQTKPINRLAVQFSIELVGLPESTIEVPRPVLKLYVPILFQQSALKSKGACPALFGDISYIVQQLDFRGAMMNQAVVLPDACSDNICKATISPTTCVVQVQTTSNYGSSSLSFLPVGEFIEQLAGMNKKQVCMTTLSLAQALLYEHAIHFFLL